MPAAVVKGILLSLGIIAALGFAAYENPDIQRWIDEQRRKLAELLRNIGAELDPSTRQAAEAFAFENRNAQSPEIQQTNDAASSQANEASRSVVATGREAGETRHRAPLQRMRDADAEERQKRGEEYLAKRNKQMLEIKQRRENMSESMQGSSFESLVDRDGKLKLEEAETQSIESRPISLVNIEPSPIQDTTTTQEASMISNPFSDEHEARSTTPKPPVPPKISLDPVQQTPIDIETTSQPPGAFPTQEASEDLSYEEQLALAISLSEQEARSNVPATRDLAASTDDAELRSAIEASLREMKAQSVPQLVDISEDPPVSVVSEEDLYSVTPNLTRARLASFNAQQAPPLPILRAVPHESAALDPAEASFYSALGSSYQASSMPSHDNGAWLRPVRDNDTETLQSGARTPTAASVKSIATSEEHGTGAAQGSGAPSRTDSYLSMELIDVEDLADADVISDDGIATPDSWTEVGSHDGDSEHETHPTLA